MGLTGIQPFIGQDKVSVVDNDEGKILMLNSRDIEGLPLNRKDESIQVFEIIFFKFITNNAMRDAQVTDALVYKNDFAALVLDGVKIVLLHIKSWKYAGSYKRAENKHIINQVQTGSRIIKMKAFKLNTDK